MTLVFGSLRTLDVSTDATLIQLVTPAKNSECHVPSLICQVAESAGIQEVQERVRDFTAALRSAGAAETAQRIERYAHGFVRATEVRRSVAAIQEQLRYFRTYPEELPDLPIVQVAANRLEDACRVALAAGLIEPARPSLRAASKRKLGVIVTTLAGAGLVFVLPLGLTMFGVDWNDLRHTRALAPARLAQGDEVSVSVNALVAAEDPVVTKGVEFYVKDHCGENLGDGMKCRRAEPRELGGAVRPTYEITLDNQVYGLFIGFGETGLLGAVGNGMVWATATWDTPEGRYEVPLQAAFTGYSPERCGILERIQDRCETKRIGDDAKHEGLPVPTVVIDVVRGDPTKQSVAKRQKEQERKQREQEAERRATELAQNVEQIKAVLDDTGRMLRKKQWELARERTDKLTELFSPLDALVVSGAEGEPLPVEVAGLRARFEEQRRQLQTFEDRAFEAAFEATHGSAGATRPAADGGKSQDARLTEVANKLKITPAYMEVIFAAHAEQLEARLAAAEAARRAQQQATESALLKRCGPLPTRAFSEIKAFLSAMGHAAHVQTRLNECLTPRLSDKHCWAVVCRFDELVPGQLTDTVRPQRWTFLMRDGRVTEHVERVIE